MPLAQHPYLAVTRTVPDNDVAWMNDVLSPSAADRPVLAPPPFAVVDGLALELDPDLPPFSFRLQFLRAWIAASGDHPTKAPGHA